MRLLFGHLGIRGETHAANGNSHVPILASLRAPAREPTIVGCTRAPFATTPLRGAPWSSPSSADPVNRTALFALLGSCALACHERPANDAGRSHTSSAPPAVELTWIVHPATAEAEAGPERIIEVEARVGRETKRLALGAHLGYLHPNDQSLCTPSLKHGDVVSQLKLDTFGTETLYATRVAPGKLEISSHVDADLRDTDGVLGAFAIPAGATLSEAIVDMRSPQVRTPFDCHGGTSDGIPKEPRILPVSPSAQVIDTRDWKSAPAGATLTATWTVDETHADSNDEDRSKVLVPVTLELRYGTRSHTVVTTASGGGLRAEDSWCGEISFYWAGAVVELEIRRAEGGKIVLVRKESFPALKNEQLFVFDAPHDLPVAQTVVVIDAKGKRTTESRCKAKTL